MYAESLSEAFKLLWYDVSDCIWNYFAFSLYSEKIALHVLLGYLVWSLPPTLWLGICGGILQFKDDDPYLLKICQLVQISMSSLVSYMALFFLMLCSLERKACGVVSNCFFYVSIYFDPVDAFMVIIALGSFCPWDLNAAGLVFCSVMIQVHLFFTTFYGVPINSRSVIHEWQCLNFCWWPAAECILWQ